MFFCYIFLVVSLVNFLRDFHVSSCEYTCADPPVFTPSRLVVKFGDPTSASCSVCQDACSSRQFGLENSVGISTTTNETIILWTVDKMSEWDASPLCYYNYNNIQCCSILLVTVYQPPRNVSISFVNHTGPMFEGDQYTLQCTVWDVAPVGNLTVTFYRGQTALEPLQLKNNMEKKPVTENFTLNITASKEDDGVQYWCEAKLNLGPEGPQPPPVVKSQNITATVLYKPQLQESSHSDPIIITAGNPLQLNCSAVGNPNPTYSWLLPTDVIPPSSDSVLTINSVVVENKGQYSCFVNNSVGSVTVKFNVDVQVNHIIGIIVGAIIAAVLAAIVVTSVFYIFYKQSRMGQYNLKDVFRLHKQHIALPTAE